MDFPKTYSDIPNRNMFLKTKETQALFDVLPARIRDSLIHAYLNASWTGSDEVVDYLTKHSVIFEINRHSPGSALAFEYLYTRQITTPIDQYFIDCKAGHQIYQRLLALEVNLPVWICLLYTSPSPRDRTRSRMPSSA